MADQRWDSAGSQSNSFAKETMNPLIVCTHLVVFKRLSSVEKEKILKIKSKKKNKNTKGFRISLFKTNDVQSLPQM